MSLENMTETTAADLAGNPADILTEDIEIEGSQTEDPDAGAEEAAETGAAKETIEKPAAAKSARKQSGFGKLFGGGKKSSKGKEKEDKGRNSEEDIRKLTRTELLELLIDETKEADRLREDNERLRNELEKCHEDLDRIASFEAVIARLEAIVNGR